MTGLDSIIGIVDPNELSQRVVLVSSRHAVPGLAGNIATTVVGVAEVQRVRTAALGNGVNERRSGVRTVCRRALYIAILRCVSRAFGHAALTGKKSAPTLL